MWLRAGEAHPKFCPSCPPSFFLLSKFFSYEHFFFHLMNIHFFKASLALFTLCCCLLSVAMNIVLSMFSLLHSLSHLPAWGSTEWLWHHGRLPIWLLLVHDHLFFYITNDITTNGFARPASPALSSTSLHLALPMASIFSCCILLSARLWAHSGQGSWGADLCISCRMCMNVGWVCV